MQSYTDLFDQRGTAYDRAMRLCPDARRAEFLQAIAPIAITPGMRVGDVPAGGGYLKNHLPPDVLWEGHEPCATFLHHRVSGTATSRPLLPLPWANAALDAAISLAGVHHLEDKRPLFSEVARVLKPGGTFVLSDVEQGSAVAHFLDGFVGAHNSTGHEGRYLGDHTLADLQATGWQITTCERQDFHWTFADRAELGQFAFHLFDLCQSTPQAVADAIEAALGVIELPNGQTGMNWSLLTIACTSPVRTTGQP